MWQTLSKIKATLAFAIIAWSIYGIIQVAKASEVFQGVIHAQ